MTEMHPWCQRVLAPLPAHLISAAVATDDPDWERIETAMVKLGSLAHTQVALDSVANDCLGLLENRTKDMRVLVHLLRCLQHAAQASKVALALQLLDGWLAAYWLYAFPESLPSKLRLLAQITQRFDVAVKRVCMPEADDALSLLPTLFTQVAARCQVLAPDTATRLMHMANLAQQALQHQSLPLAGSDAVSVGGQAEAPAAKRRQHDTGATISPTVTPSGSGSGEASRAMAGSSNPEEITGERAWRQRQLKMADMLVETQPAAAMGYRLRRHALWGAIQAVPLTTQGLRTSLAAMPCDLVADYRAALVRPDRALWVQIERSLVLAPYWFEGHLFSAQVAEKLGYAEVARAIAEELTSFLNRLPRLRDLTFSDGSPFLSAACQQWLAASDLSAADGETSFASMLSTCYQTQGVTAALQRLDEYLLQQQEPRGRFYGQLAGADLLAQAGLSALAAQHYQHLWLETQRLGLSQWEPGLVSRLAHHVTMRSN